MDTRKNREIKCCGTCIHYAGKWKLNPVPMKCDFWKEKTLDFDCCQNYQFDQNGVMQHEV